MGPDQHHAVAEAFRSLRTSITFMAAGGQPLADDDAVGVVLVASPAPGEGKTTIAANLAAAFAETGRSVVVVNADVRRPALGALLTDRDRPLPAGLAGINRLDAAEFLIPTIVPGVDLLDLSPIGASPGDITRATVRLVAALRDRIDVILIDTPPLAVTTEALEFVPGAEVVVLAGRMGRTTVDPARRAGELTRFGGAEQIAVVLTATGSAHLRRKRYYGYYGKHRAGPERKTAEEHIRVAADDTGESRPDVEALPVLALGPSNPPNGDQGDRGRCRGTLAAAGGPVVRGRDSGRRVDIGCVERDRRDPRQGRHVERRRRGLRHHTTTPARRPGDLTHGHGPTGPRSRRSQRRCRRRRVRRRGRVLRRARPRHGTWPYEQWMVLVLVPLLFTAGVVGILVVTRDDSDRLTSMMVACLSPSSVRHSSATSSCSRSTVAGLDRLRRTS